MTTKAEQLIQEVLHISESKIDSIVKELAVEGANYGGEISPGKHVFYGPGRSGWDVTQAREIERYVDSSFDAKWVQHQKLQGRWGVVVKL